MASPAIPIYRPASGTESGIWGGKPITSSGSNQFFPTMPSLPSMPGSTPTANPGGGGGGSTLGGPIDFSQFNWSGYNPGAGPSTFVNKGSGVAAEPGQFPGLQQNWANYLKSQIGQGTPANPLLSMLLNFFGGGGSQGIPGAGTLSDVATSGINVLPVWQAMTNAQQQNIAQNQANLREQFASMGDLAGSPFGTAMSNYMSQTTADQNSLLGQLNLQGILQGQLPAAENLFGGAMGMGEFGQSLLPQNNPLNQYLMSMTQQYAPMYGLKQGGGVLGGLLPSLMQSIGLLAGMCDVAASFWGWDDPRTKKVQWWMMTQADPDIAMFYFLNAKRIAKTPHRWKFKPLFDAVVEGGR